MGLGAVFFTLPVALLGAIWARVLHGVDIVALLGTYSAVGLMTMLILLVAVSTGRKARD